MKRLFALTLLAFALPSAGALAQSTATPSQMGYLTNSGCYPGQTVCFAQYGATVPISGSITANNASVGTNGSTAPTSSTQIGIKDGSGNLQPASAANPVPTVTSPGSRTLVTLDVKTVTTGGTPVTAIAVGHRTAGGLLCNPQGATINLGINEIGTASGTTSSGDTTFIVPGQCYTVVPAAGGVSVITSDSAHPFSGYGLN